MKKIFFIIAFFPFMSEAQHPVSFISKNRIFLNAQSNGQWLRIDDAAVKNDRADTYYTIYLGAGYTPSNNLVIGGNIYASNILITLNKPNLLAGPFMRYYFPLKQLYLFVQGGIYAGKRHFGTLDYTGSDPIIKKDKLIFLNYEILGGLSFPLSKYVSFDLAGGYEVLTERGNSENFITKNLGIRLGFSFFLNTGKEN